MRFEDNARNSVVNRVNAKFIETNREVGRIIVED